MTNHFCSGFENSEANPFNRLTRSPAWCPCPGSAHFKQEISTKALLKSNRRKEPSKSFFQLDDRILPNPNA